MTPGSDGVRTRPSLTRRQFLLSAGAMVAFGVPGAAQTPVAIPNIPLVRVVVSRLPETMAPGASSLLDHLWLDTLSLDSPSRWSATGSVLSGIATRMPASEVDEEFGLVVRPGALFFDGTPVHADDIRYTLERIRNHGGAGQHAWRLEHIRRIETVDDLTIRITLDRPDASLTSSLAHQVFGVVPAGADVETVEGGTGPFFRQSMDAERMLFERNPFFWQVGRPRIDTLQVTAIGDDSQRATAMAGGQVDILPNAPLLDIPMLREEPTVYLAGGPSNRVCHLQINMAVPEFSDARVRRLLSRAINRARLVDVATAGQATPTGRLFPADSWVATELPEIESLSPETVREELRALGIPTDLRVRLLTDNADATLANTAIVLQEQLASCGIALSVDLLEGDDLAEAILLRDYDLLAGYTEPWRDPHELVRPLLASDGNRNRSGYTNQRVDVLIRGGILKEDRAFRRERYARIEEAIEGDTPVIVLFHPYYYDAVSSDMVGYGVLPPVTSRGLLPVKPGPVGKKG